ncbi:MAG: hypothetical protein MUE44_10760 [Oscillatoriaceae cyanobacterium Prado104]|jgi:hypothetical protein|nr:hypothetical protein [Oscillatoriaceae cyanobacterium Prado104]
MYLLTLSDLDRTVRASQLQEPALVPAFKQERLQLLVKQILMGLPVEQILKNHPQFEQWVFQLKELSPTLFLPQRKLFVDIPLQAKLDLIKQRETAENSSPSHSFKAIQVRANVGAVKGKPKLFEWAIRHPVMTWQDRVKLWVAAEFFEIEPHKLQLIVLALHPTQRAQKVQFTWDSDRHRQIQNWLLKTIKLEFQQTVSKPNRYLIAQPQQVATAIDFANINLDEINEVSI